MKLQLISEGMLPDKKRAKLVHDLVYSSKTFAQLSRLYKISKPRITALAKSLNIHRRRRPKPTSGQVGRAKRMLTAGRSIQQIIQSTGLNKTEITSIKRSMGGVEKGPELDIPQLGNNVLVPHSTHTFY